MRRPRVRVVYDLTVPVRCTYEERDRWMRAAKARRVDLVAVARRAWEALCEAPDAPHEDTSE